MPKSTPLDGPALTYRDFLLIGAGSLSVFPLDALRAELLALSRTLDLPRDPRPLPPMDSAEWAALITDFIDTLGPSAGSGAAATWRGAATPTALQVVAVGLQQALVALRADYRDQSGPPTGALLPTSFARRIDVLFGSEKLPLVWVREVHLD